MTKKFFYVGVAAIALILTTGIVAGISSAQDGQSRPAITDEQKQEIRQLIQDGKFDELKALKEELGLGEGRLHQWPEVKINPEEMKAKMDAIKAAIDSNDYTAWLNAVGADSPIAKAITADKFAQYIEAQKHFEAGQAILNDLGLNKGEGPGMRMFGFGGHMFHGAPKVEAITPPAIVQ